MMGFDEWIDEAWKNKDFWNSHTKSSKMGYEAGVASRQAEIDALSVLGEMSEQKVDDLVLRNIELQKRIESITDTLIDHLDYEYDELDCPSYDAMLYALREVKEILKGKEND